MLHLRILLFFNFKVQKRVIAGLTLHRWFNLRTHTSAISGVLVIICQCCIFRLLCCPQVLAKGVFEKNKTFFKYYISVSADAFAIGCQTICRLCNNAAWHILHIHDGYCLGNDITLIIDRHLQMQKEYIDVLRVMAYEVGLVNVSTGISNSLILCSSDG